MKIAFLIPDLRVGGAERNIIRLANNLCLRGHDVTVIVLRKDGAFLGDLVGVEVVSLNVRRALFSFFKVCEFLRQHPSTIVCSTLAQMNLILAVCGIVTGRLRNCVIRLENVSSDIGFNGGMGFYLLCQWLFRYVPVSVAISNGVRDSFQTFRLPNIETIYNPAWSESIRDLSRKPFYLSTIDSKFVFVSACRFVPAKNHTVLINAFRYVIDSLGPEKVALICVGSGPLFAKTKALAENLGLSNSIIFTGELSNPYPVIARGDVFILHSLREGFGNSLVEGMGLCDSVIATDCQAGPAEILEHGKVGLLVTNNNSKALAQAMIKSITMKPNVSLRARVRDFDEKIIATEYEKVFLAIDGNLKKKI